MDIELPTELTTSNGLNQELTQINKELELTQITKKREPQHTQHSSADKELKEINEVTLINKGLTGRNLTPQR